MGETSRQQTGSTPKEQEKMYSGVKVHHKTKVSFTICVQCKQYCPELECTSWWCIFRCTFKPKKVTAPRPSTVVDDYMPRRNNFLICQEEGQGKLRYSKGIHDPYGKGRTYFPLCCFSSSLTPYSKVYHFNWIEYLFCKPRGITKGVGLLAGI